MTPDRSHSDTVGRVANKVRVEEVEAPFNPSTFRNIALLTHFLRQRFLIFCNVLWCCVFTHPLKIFENFQKLQNRYLLKISGKFSQNKPGFSHKITVRVFQKFLGNICYFSKNSLTFSSVSS